MQTLSLEMWQQKKIMGRIDDENSATDACSHAYNNKTNQRRQTTQTTYAQY